MEGIMNDIINASVSVQSEKIYNELMKKRSEKKGDKVTAAWYEGKIAGQAMELAFLERVADCYGGAMNYYAAMEKGKIRSYVLNFGLLDIDDKKTQKEWQDKIDKYYAKGVA